MVIRIAGLLLAVGCGAQAQAPQDGGGDALACEIQVALGPYIEGASFSAFDDDDTTELDSCFQALVITFFQMRIDGTDAKRVDVYITAEVGDQTSWWPHTYDLALGADGGLYSEVIPFGFNSGLIVDLIGHEAFVEARGTAGDCTGSDEARLTLVDEISCSDGN